MSESTYVQVVIPPDVRWKEMSAIENLCERQGVKVPTEVELYLDQNRATKDGVLEPLNRQALTTQTDDATNHFIVDLELVKKLHPRATHIQFTNSY